MKVSVSPAVVFMGLIFLISGNIRQAFIPLLAAAIHEIGHITFAYLSKIKIERLDINLFGALISICPIGCTYKKEAMLAASGPITNIIFAIFAYALLQKSNYDTDRGIILFIISSLFFAFINLLPAESFDGGRILNCCLLSVCTPDTASKIMEWVSLLCIFLLWSVSVYFILKTGSYLSLFVFSGSIFSKIYLLHRKKEIG